MKRKKDDRIFIKKLENKIQFAQLFFLLLRQREKFIKISDLNLIQIRQKITTTTIESAKKKE